MSSDNHPTERQTDAMDSARANAFLAALGDPERLGPGDPLPTFFHQLYFWSAKPPDELGRDGHPKVGGLIPDMGLPRRMWAGGRLEFAKPLHADTPAERITQVEKSTRKIGRSGPLGFVTLRHDIVQNGTCCLSEWQDLVYREDPAPDAVKPAAPTARTDEDVAVEVAFDATLLFRYSALTFNGHRIHYDVEYARQVEGYGGLVVHGPLLAQLLMRLGETHLGPLSTFSFRATSPLMDYETATLCLKGRDLWVRGPDGRQCMQARA